MTVILKCYFFLKKKLNSDIDLVSDAEAPDFKSSLLRSTFGGSVSELSTLWPCLLGPAARSVPPELNQCHARVGGERREHRAEEELDGKSWRGSRPALCKWAPRALSGLCLSVGAEHADQMFRT